MAMTNAQKRALAIAKAKQRATQGNGAPPDKGGGILGNADALMRGAADTLTLGFADEIAAGLGALTGIGGDAGEFSQNLAEQRARDRQDKTERGGYRLAGQLAGGVGGGVGLSKSGLSLGANAIRAGRTLPAVATASGAEGALLGAGYGAGSGENARDRIKQALIGAETGVAVGAAAPAAISGASSAARRLVSPFTMSPERRAAAAVLQREGVQPTAGQTTGSNRLRYMESEMGGGAAANMLDKQGEAFTDAAMRRAGSSGRATPENMKALSDRLGRGFDEISSRNVLNADHTLVSDMNSTMQDYARVLPSEQRKIVGNMVGDIVQRIKSGGGKMSGEDYQTIRSRLTKRAQNARNSDAELADAYRGLRNSLDSAMDRSIRPEDAGAWRELRRQYSNMKVLERAATGGGENAALGLISPAKLRQAATTGNRGGYARGEGDFSELSRAGNALLTPLPNSGTAGRISARNLGVGVSTLLGAGAGAPGGPVGAIAGGLLGSAVPAAAGRALMSRPVQKYLTNQALAGPISPAKRAILNALLNGSASPAAVNSRLP